MARNLAPRTTTTIPKPRLEIKQIVDDIPLGTSNNNSSVSPFGLVAEGSNPDQRNGRAIKHIEFDIAYTLESSSSAQWTNTRVVYGIYKQAFGVALSTSTIFDLRGGPGNIRSAYNFQNSSNLVILGDRIHNLRPSTSAGTLTGGTGTIQPVTVEEVYRFPNIKFEKIQEYISTGASDVSQWCHFIAVIAGDNSGGSTSVCNVTTVCRYVDV